jgi:Fe-S-cluster containining protein
MITIVEAHRLAMLVAELPEPRQGQIRLRFSQAIARLEQAGLLGPAGQRCWLSSESGEAARNDTASRYFRLGIPCPFLEHDSCSIHPERPLVCREYLVTSEPERCERYLEEAVRMVPYLGVTRALGRTCQKLFPSVVEGLPLVLALEHCEEPAAALSSPVDGVEAFRAFLSELGETRELDGAAGAFGEEP